MTEKCKNYFKIRVPRFLGAFVAFLSFLCSIYVNHYLKINVSRFLGAFVAFLSFL